MELIILLVSALSLLYYLTKKHYSYWRRNGVPGPTPLPILGNFGKSVIGKASVSEIITQTYRKYDKYPFVGLFKATTRYLVARDPEFIKHIILKDFKHFNNNDIVVHKDLDPLLGLHPFCMKGTEWRNKRAELTQCFTFAKVKAMYGYMENNGNKMVRYIEEETKNSTTLIEARELSVLFTLENVAVCAFGLEGQSFEKYKSEFEQLAEDFHTVDNWTKVKIWLAFNFPIVNKYIRVKYLSADVTHRLTDIVRRTLKYRKENNIVRNDFLDVCCNISTEDGLLTELDIIAHAATFFGDGYETSSRSMAFMLFEIASNPDIQEKLRKEICESFEKNGNKFTYESIHEMAYLEACLKENLRKNTILAYLSKNCTEDYEYTSTSPDYEKLKVQLKEGDAVALPLTGIHMDPKYYPEPEKFIPERFLQKGETNKYVYLPWGEGQRLCLGIRYAQTQIKVGVANIIKNFRLTVNSKTQLPLKYHPFEILLVPIGGLWLDFEKIE